MTEETAAAGSEIPAEEAQRIKRFIAKAVWDSATPVERKELRFQALVAEWVKFTWEQKAGDLTWYAYALKQAGMMPGIEKVRQLCEPRIVITQKEPGAVIIPSMEGRT